MRTACIDLTEATRSEQLFKINGFSTTKEKSGFMASASRIWTLGGLDWLIDFNPNYSKDGECCIMFRVTLISRASGVAAAFICRLVDPNLKRDPCREKITSSRFYQNSGQDVFLTTRDNLVASGYVKDEYFLVQCAIAVLSGEPKDAAAMASNVMLSGATPSSDLQKQFGELLQSQTGTDITFLISGESVCEHRCVLVARSLVFMAELVGDTKEKAAQCAEIKDMEADVFKALLRFIYTDTLPELDAEGEQATVVAQHMLEASDRFGLQRLKAICVERVCTGVSVETAATTLGLAEQNRCSKLKASCMEFILATPVNFHAGAATEGTNISRHAASLF